LFEICKERDVPSLRRQRTVSYNGTAGFWEDDHKDEEYDNREDDEEPENGTPTEELVEETADNGSNCMVSLELVLLQKGYSI
jgi:hypothetical protein